MKGGVVFFRGTGSAARAYLESDHSHADDYYLEHGTAEAHWDQRSWSGRSQERDVLSGEQYQAWVDWNDPHTGESRGTPREEARVSTASGEMVTRPSSPRFVEMTVNNDKSLSVAAALDERVSAALDDAQAAAVEAMRDYLAQHSVTRVGPKGQQRFVPVERIESVAVVHRTSRAGDPHRHVHLQWNARVFAEGKWRGLHTGGTLGQQDALRGIAEAAINSHAGLREALAQAGFEFDASSGKVVNLEQHAVLMSKRAAQVQAGKAVREAAWRDANPGIEPTQKMLNQWDFEAWADGRPQKAQASGRSEAAWIEEMKAAGLRTSGFTAVARPETVPLQQLDWQQIARDAVSVCESRGSAWSRSTLSGRIAEQISHYNVAATPIEIVAYSDQLARWVADRSPVIDDMFAGLNLPDFVPCLTSDRVVEVERFIKVTLARRGLESGITFDGAAAASEFSVSIAQGQAAEALGSAAPLIVVEGAAGSGKTTMLKAAREIAEREGRTLVVVAPTLRAAQEASASVGVAASSAHRLAYEHGYRWTATGVWTRLDVGQIDPTTGAAYTGPRDGYTVTPHTRIVVDEAGMLDQDVAHALITVAEENGAALAFIGDRAQLAAVGRGGVLDFAVASTPRPLDLSEVHRFRDKDYAALSLRMREREEPREIFHDLHARGDVRVHATEQAMHEAILRDAVQSTRAGHSVAIAAATNEQAAVLNAAIQKAHADNGRTNRTRVSVAGSDHLTIRRGDKIMTRMNDTELGVANRDVWTVKNVRRDGAVTAVSDYGRTVTLPAEYVQKNTHLAYASTEYGVQGATVNSGHGIVTDSSSAQGVYVAATRGRDTNTLHIVAETTEAAADVFTNAMLNEAGDRGLAPAVDRAARHLDGMIVDRVPVEPVPAEPVAFEQPESAPAVDTVPPVDERLRADRQRAESQVYQSRLRGYEHALQSWRERFPDVEPAAVAETVQRLDGEVQAINRAVGERQTLMGAAAEHRFTQSWGHDYATAAQAQHEADSANMFTRSKLSQAAENTTRAFIAKYGVQPQPQPSPETIAQVKAAAVAPGADAQLDSLRNQAAQLRQRRDELKAAHVPTPPQAPHTGTPAQEAAKDRKFAALSEMAASQRQSSSKYRAPENTRTPGLER